MANLLSYSLTTLADVKESLGIAASDTSYDNLIIRKINQATIAIEKYTGRRFLSTVYTDEEYDATGTDQLVLKQRPITTLTSISSRDTSLNEADWDVLDTNVYFYDANSGVVALLFNTTGRWNRYKVTYTAGYSTIPEDIAEAAASLASYYVLNADASAIGVSSKQEGQRSVNYNATKQNFASILENLGIDGIIQSYANYPLAGL
jgi:hypothetical protein